MENKRYTLDYILTYRENYIINSKDIDTKTVEDRELYYHIISDADIILKKLGMSPHKVGYQYWRDAIAIYILSDKIHLNITKDIYPILAEKYNKKVASIERAMTICIDNVTYYTSKNEVNTIKEFIPTQILYPKNSMILALVAEIIVTRKFQDKKFQYA